MGTQSLKNESDISKSVKVIVECSPKAQANMEKKAMKFRKMHGVKISKSKLINKILENSI